MSTGVYHAQFFRLDLRLLDHEPFVSGNYDTSTLEALLENG